MADLLTASIFIVSVHDQLWQGVTDLLTACIFIVLGTDTSEREECVKKLNDDFQKRLREDDKLSRIDVYRLMVKSIPDRVLRQGNSEFSEVIILFMVVIKDDFITSVVF